MIVKLKGFLKDEMQKDVLNLTGVTDTDTISKQIKVLHPEIDSKSYRISVNGKIIHGNFRLLPDNELLLITLFEGG